MASTRKCPICNNLLGFDISDDKHVVPYKNRYAHITCFNNMLKITNRQTDEEKKKKLADKKSKKQSSPKTIPVLKEGLTEEEFKIKKAYFDKLKALLNIERLEARHYKVSENYMNKYNWTYQGMLNALIYYFDILGKEVQGDCVGTLPYCYDEAQKLYESRQSTEEYNKDVLKNTKNISSLYTTNRIKFSPPKPQLDLIDISSIGIGGDNSDG